MITERQRRKWAKQVKAARQKKGATQEQVAAESKHSLSYLQKIENGMDGSEKAVRYLLELIPTIKLTERRSA